jgi:hypothetical protein
MDGRVQITSLEAWSGWVPSVLGNPEGKRGDMQYLKIPVNNITSVPLAQFGPADDSNVYVLIRVDFPDYSVQQGLSAMTADVQAGNGFSGFASSGIAATFNDLSVAVAPCRVFRYFLMPTNL